jgi:pyridoxal phosphate enzyme (YggS family)
MIDAAAVAGRVAAAREAVAEAAGRAGRDSETVEILAATKYVAVEDIPALAQAGLRLMGENRTDALLAKQAVAPPGLTWDFIGALQSRKARDLVGRVRLVHSLSTLSAAEQLDRRTSEPVRCLVEVNLAGEESKEGVPEGDLDAFLQGLAPVERVAVEGLMTMPPLAGEPEASRPYFARLRALAASLEGRWTGRFSFARLSMGTSQDYVVAVEEGATIVRLGSVLYGRPGE